MTAIQTLTIRRPDDFHVHLRDGEYLAATVPFTARQFARALVMPNLKPPMTTVALVSSYRERILKALPASLQFQPLMSLYLTNATSAEEIRKAKQMDFIIGGKLYPAGATTHSDAGVTAIENL